MKKIKSKTKLKKNRKNGFIGRFENVTFKF